MAKTVIECPECGSESLDVEFDSIGQKWYFCNSCINLFKPPIEGNMNN